MTEQLPDEWFRPAGKDGSAAGAPQSGSRVESPGTPAAAWSAVADDERYTDQFKPGYQEHAPRGVSADQTVTAVRPASSVSASSVSASSALADPAWASARSLATRPAVSAASRSSWLGRHPVLATALVVVVALAVGLSAGQWWRTRQQSTSPQMTTVAPSGAATSTALKPYDGATKPVKPTAVTASCLADPAQDANGDQVTYQPELVLDSNPATAWRCNSDGVGQQLTFTFPPDTVLVGVGLINGYAKTSGKDQLYQQYRRVTMVEWRLSNNSYFFNQSLSDNNLTLQQVSIPPVATGATVTLTITASTAPGLAGDPSRDAVLLSQVQFFTKA